jgi:uncharacterized protein
MRLRPSLVIQLTIGAVLAVAALAVLVRWMEPRIAFFPSAGERETPRDFGVAHEAATIATADGERLRAWIMRVPEARARIVYFHGNGANLSNWAPILAGVVRAGYSVVAFDYRGYGLSTGRPSERGLHRDVEAVVAQAWADADRTPVLYWGRSLGGAMAAYAATIREPDGLILESAFPDARSVVRGSVLGLLYPLASYRFATAELMTRVRRPVLVIHGDRDSVIPFALGRALFDRLQEPKRFVVVPGGDHNDGAPADPAAYWAAIAEFVDRLPRSGWDRGKGGRP